MKLLRILLGAVGAGALAIGVGLMAVSAGLFAWIGGDDVVALPEVHVHTDDGLVVTDDIGLFYEGPDRARFVPDLGSAEVTVTTPDGETVFVGIAPAGEVTRADLLAGQVGGIDWATFDTGSTATVDWDLEPGEWTFVVWSPTSDGGIDLAVDAELTAAPFRAAGAVAGGTGLAFVIAGGLLLAGAVVSSRRPETPTPAPAAA